MDLGSSRGSKVNGKTTSGRVTLKIGDRIKVGKTDMLFTILDESGEPIL
jgi:pSer/pThr/pTyr-binding forkhead associated (FHA) protein